MKVGCGFGEEDSERDGMLLLFGRLNCCASDALAAGSADGHRSPGAETDWQKVVLIFVCRSQSGLTYICTPGRFSSFLFLSPFLAGPPFFIFGNTKKKQERPNLNVSLLPFILICPDGYKHLTDAFLYTVQKAYKKKQ